MGFIESNNMGCLSWLTKLVSISLLLIFKSFSFLCLSAESRVEGHFQLSTKLLKGMWVSSHRKDDNRKMYIF